MKKFIALLSAFLCFVSCTGYKDIKINSVQVEKVSLIGAPLGASIALEVENPTVTLKITDVSGVVKVAGEEVLDFTLEPFTLKGHSTQVYHLDLSASLKSGFGIYNVLRIVQSSNPEDVKVDVSVTARDPLGIKHVKDKKDLSVL